MIDLNPKFITDKSGEKLVVISLQEFDNIIEELEDLEDIRLYDEAKDNDDGIRVLFSDYLKDRKNSHV